MREEGYYWVKYGGIWKVAFWCRNTWWSHNVMDSYRFEEDLEEIDEKPILREKPKMSKEQITKAEELISDTIRKVDKLFGLL